MLTSEAMTEYGQFIKNNHDKIRELVCISIGNVSEIHIEFDGNLQEAISDCLYLTIGSDYNKLLII